MPARLFHCEIRNAGAGSLFCIHGILDHGDWSHDSRPWESASPIGPGEIKTFQSESSFGVFGTTGYATFRTAALASGETSTHPEFLKISWDLPYFKLDTRDVDPNEIVDVNEYRFDPNPDSGDVGSSEQFVVGDHRPVISHSVLVSSTPVDFGEQLQNAPELFVGGVVNPLAVFGVNVPDHVYCLIVVSGSAAPDTTPHTVPGFSDGRAVPPNPVPLKGSSLEQWTGPWEGDHVTAFIGAAGNALEVTAQEQRQTGQYTIRGNGVPIEQVKVHPDAMPEQPVGTVASSGTHTSNRLATGEGAAGTVVQRHSNPRWIGVEQGTSFVGDYISLPEDASIEIYRLISGNTMVGQALRYRRPTSHIVSVVESFDEFLYRKVNIA
jgi:hypothetical protein